MSVARHIRMRQGSRAVLDFLPIPRNFGNHDMTMTRRSFLSASAAFAAGSVASRNACSASLPREADIVVIGAGAAGIAAARRIMAANRKVLLVEASSQIGGRCLTDLSTFDRSEEHTSELQSRGHLVCR